MAAVVAVLGWQGWPRCQGRFCSFEGLEDLELLGFKDVLAHLNSLVIKNDPGEANRWPRAPQERPRAALERSKGAKRRPKVAQEAIK